MYSTASQRQSLGVVETAGAIDSRSQNGLQWTEDMCNVELPSEAEKEFM